MSKLLTTNGSNIVDMSGTWAYNELITTNGINYNPYMNHPATNKNKERIESMEKVLDDKVKTTVVKVIFNPPATIVFWGDETKTVVKCVEDDPYIFRIGLAMCVLKKICGRRLYHEIMKINIPITQKKNLYDYIMIQYFGGLKEYKTFLREWLPDWSYKKTIDIWEPKKKKEK